MLPVVIEALRWCQEGHDDVGQVRKYTGEPYWTHPVRVANRVLSICSDPQVYAAALLHDILEDVTPTSKRFTDRMFQDTFPKRVVDIVMTLTDHYTPKNFPDMNRATRKRMEAIRFSEDASLPAGWIKLADHLDNYPSVREYSPSFALVYRDELTDRLTLYPNCSMKDELMDELAEPIGDAK